jgi:hypothetical protein
MNYMYVDARFETPQRSHLTSKDDQRMEHDLTAARAPGNL